MPTVQDVSGEVEKRVTILFGWETKATASVLAERSLVSQTNGIETSKLVVLKLRS
jgi:hypothetical protein